MKGRIFVRFLKNRSGSMAVEAAVIFPLFIIFMFSFIMLIKFSYVYLSVQQGLSEATAELGAYAYVLHATRVDEFSHIIHDTANHATEQMNQEFDIVDGIVDQVGAGQFAALEELDGLMVLNDPVNFLKVASINALGDLYKEGEAMLIGALVKHRMPVYMGSRSEEDLNTTLLAMGVQGGLDGLSIRGFPKTVNIDSESVPELLLVRAEYEISFDPPLNVFIDTWIIAQQCAVPLWSGTKR